MSVLIIYKSYHRMNTEMVAKAMAEVLGAKLVKAGEVKPEDLAAYDLIGFGSGIYGGRYHKELSGLVEKLPEMNKDAFLFSTSGALNEKYSISIREQLGKKDFSIVGEFTCLGASGFWIWEFVNKGHPDDKDLENARAFAKGLVKG